MYMAILLRAMIVKAGVYRCRSNALLALRYAYSPRERTVLLECLLLLKAEDKGLLQSHKVLGYTAYICLLWEDVEICFMQLAPAPLCHGIFAAPGGVGLALATGQIQTSNNK